MPPFRLSPLLGDSSSPPRRSLGKPARITGGVVGLRDKLRPGQKGG